MVINKNILVTNKRDCCNTKFYKLKKNIEKIETESKQKQIQVQK